MNFMKTVQKVKEVKTEEVISGNDNDYNHQIIIYTYEIVEKY